ncbi:unnamed protein product [Auanema sp. JU1783]|nr:unnamed protein product [Auanema sp. JU1783]
MNFLGPAVNAIKPRLDDSGMDRLNYYYSSMVILFCSLTITAKQYVGAPLQCWVPAQFTHAWEQYAENYCFVYNTYWVKPGENVPQSVEERVAQQLIYYQWVPFLMGLEAAFFYFPALFWGQTSNKSGLNIVNIVETAQKAEQEDETSRRKKVDIIVGHIRDSIKLQKVRSRGSNLVMRLMNLGKLDGCYIANLYTLTKMFYVLNLIGQFLMMNKFLGQNNHWWGFHILSDILAGTDWELSGNFPRIAMCDFQVRVLGNLQRYSIQCVLSLNMFNEKIFLFLYWWFVLVGVFTLVDLLSLLRDTRTEGHKITFIRKY